MAFFLLALSALVHFAFFGHPQEVVFDEVHYGKFVNGYLKGEYFFSGHPPAGPQLLALGAWLGGYRATHPFDHIGEKWEGKSSFGLRLLPNLAGVFIPVFAYWLMRVLGASLFSSLLLGAALIFENGLVAQSRLALVDAFLVFFGLLGLLFFFLARARHYSPPLLLAAGVFFGLSAAVKWSGLGFMASIAPVLGIDAFEALRQRQWGMALRWFARSALSFLAVPALCYFAVFVLHFSLLPRSGPGDIFMSQAFRQGEKGIVGKFLELNKINYLSNLKNLTASHPYSSSLLAWPFMARPLYYWGGAGEEGYMRIYFLGNPVVWWGSTLGLFLAFLFWNSSRRGLKIFLLLGYLLNLLPFAGATRPFFLYHYLPALLFALMATFFMLGDFMDASPLFQKKKYWAAGALAAVVLAGFLFFAPLSYGLPLSERAYALRVWFAAWQ